MTKKQKDACIAQIDTAIKTAPNDPERVAKLRAFKPRKLKNLSNWSNEVFRWDQVQGNIREIGQACESASLEKITFEFGQTRYKVWNTVENLTSFKKRFKSKY